MAGAYYKKFDIVDRRYYRPPAWLSTTFDDIEGREFEVQEGDRLDIIAEQLFNDPSLWKALALYNNISYFFDLKPGMIIKIPLRIKDITDRI